MATAFACIRSAIVSATCPSEEGFREALSKPILAPGTCLGEIRRFISQRIPSLDQPKSAEEWRARAPELRKRFLDEIVFRGTPEEWRSWVAQPQWGEVIETGQGS